MEIKKYASFHRALIESHKKEQQEITKKAYSSLPNIVALLKNKPGVKKAILFGSLLNGTFRENSDIDIAIEGVSPDDFFSIWRELEEKTGMNIDLIDLKPQNIPIYNIIKNRGEIIYEKHK